MLGGVRTAQEILGRPCNVLYPPHGREEIVDSVWSCNHHGQHRDSSHCHKSVLSVYRRETVTFQSRNHADHTFLARAAHRALILADKGCGDLSVNYVAAARLGDMLECSVEGDAVYVTRRNGASTELVCMAKCSPIIWELCHIAFIGRRIEQESCT